MKPFGVFVEMKGFRRQGLVHISRMANRRVEKPEDVTSEGEQVFVKVTAIEDGGKVI